MKKIFAILSLAGVLTVISCNNSSEQSQTKESKEIKIENDPVKGQTKEVNTNDDVKVTIPLPPPPPSPKEVLKRLPKPPLPPLPPPPPLPKKKG